MFLIVATFKSNKTSAEVESWLKQVAPVVKSSPTEIVVAPSFPHLHLISDKPANRQTNSPTSRFADSLKLAAQDVSPFPPGSYTGAVSAVQLQDLGVKYCLVGHSERRRYFHETHAEIANKVFELLAVGITPILCLSEADIFPSLAALSAAQKSKLIYCFEPPANIGGTEAAPAEEIKRVTGLIKKAVGDQPVMYGGSVNAENLSSLLSLNLDGVLVSSASLKAEEFISLIKSYSLRGK